MHFIIKIIVSALAVLITSYLLKGVTIAENSFFTTSSPGFNRFITALMIAVVLAFLNAIVKPVLTILSLPITLFTFGLFLLVINAIIILFAHKLVPGFYVDGFWTALWFSIVLSVVSWFLELFKGKQEEND